MNIPYRIQLFIFLAIGFLHNLLGQSYEVLHHLTVENGLPSNETYSSFRTEEGNIWICTDEGLARFDGENIKVFTQKDGLNGKAVFKGVKDKLGKVWLITSGGISILKGDSIFTPKFNVTLTTHQNYSLLKDLTIGDNGVVYASTVAPNIGIFKLIEGEVSFIEFPDEIRSGCNEQLFQYKIDSVNFIFGLLKSNWQSNCIDSVYEYSLGNNTVVSYSNSILKSGTNQYDIKVKDYSSYLMIRDVILRYDRNMNLTDQILLDKVHLTIDTYLFDQGGSSDTYSNRASFWIENEGASINYNMITSLDYNRNREFAFSTLDNGFYIVLVKSFNLYDLGSDMDLNRISLPVKFDSDVISVYANGYIYQYNTASLGLESKKCVGGASLSSHAMSNHIHWHEDSDAFLSYARLLMNGRSNTWSIQPINEVGSYISQCAGIGSNMFVAKGERQILLKSFSGKVLSVKGFASSLSKLFYLEGSRLVVSTNDSAHIFYLDTLTGTIESLRKHPVRNVTTCYFLGDTILYGTDTDGLFWSKVNSGLIYNVRFQFSEAESVRSIAVKRDSIWVGTNVHLNLILGLFDKNQQITGYKALRMPVDQVFPDHEGSVFIRSGMKIVHLRISELGHIRKDKIGIRSFAIDGTYRPHNRIDNAVIYEGQSVLIIPRLNNLMRNRLQKYMYRLSMYDTIWRNADRNQIWISGLTHGKYSLEIKNVNTYGLSEGDEMLVELNIKRNRKINSYYIYLTMMIITIGLFFYSIKGIKNSFFRSNKVYHLEIILNGLKMNPHFLFNSLNALKLLLKSDSVTRAMAYLTAVSNLMREILESSDKSLVNFEREMKRLVSYLELEKLRQPNLFKYYINYEKGFSANEFVIPPMMLQPLVENSIWHGFRNMTEGGVISISLLRKSNNLEIKIQDNGSGMNKSHAMVPGHAPSALKNIESRLKALSILNRKRYKIVVESIRDQGFSVKLIIPQ